MRANAHYRHSRVTFVAPGRYTDPRRTQILGCTTTSKDGNSGSCTGYSDGGWMLRGHPLFLCRELLPPLLLLAVAYSQSGFHCSGWKCGLLKWALL